MVEPVRLVVWDLDGTFWGGTLTEGGHTYSDANHNIVIELAKRGIVSSICSKNDRDTIKRILEDRGIWDYFVFPSINWNPKGPRLKQLIEDVQLRPESVLLIDDNPLNLDEAKHFVPGIQTADETVISSILESPLFKGKDDNELSRLKQYRLLQSRKADEAVATDNTEFLRSCNITITVDANIEANIDRAVELINRTNQLNFTKRRLREDPEAARRQLLKLLRSFKYQAGLIRVTDRYGDYGYCGFYLVKTSRGGRSTLHQFCFSCRILNMGVENWMYERLGRPGIKGAVEIPSELQKETNVDWIMVTDQADLKSGGVAKNISDRRVFIRGACSVSPLAHYFGIVARDVIGEFHELREFVQVRRDHVLMLQYGIEGLTPEQRDILYPLGYTDADFATAFADTSNEPALRILCNWADCQSIVYRHRKTGFLLPYKMRRMKRTDTGGRFNPIELSDDDQNLASVSEDGLAALRYLREDFELIGRMPEDAHIRAWDVIFHALPTCSPIFVVAAPEDSTNDDPAGVESVKSNARVRRVAARHPDKSITIVTLNEFAGEGERQSVQHFNRTVYFRLYEEIWRRYLEATKEERLPRKHRGKGIYQHLVGLFGAGASGTEVFIGPQKDLRRGQER